MAVHIYKEASEGVYTRVNEYDVSDGFLPVITTHDGSLGEVVETRLFIRNDDALEYYTNLQVDAASKDSNDDVSGVVTGFGVKLRTGALQPTEAEWAATDYGNAISIEDLGALGLSDTSSYLPFWFREETPASATLGNKTNVVLRVTGVESSV